MKNIAKRLAALALVLALAAGMLEQTALASAALGAGLVDRTAELAEGVFWTAQSLWSESRSDLRTENYITYIPGNGVMPIIYNGSYVASWSTVTAAAAALEEQGYRVIAGINGGFFNGDSTIVGILMTEGVVRSLDLYNGTLLGFTWDGQVFIDEGRQMTKTVSWGTEDDAKQYRLTGFNALRNNDDLGGLYLYNQDFSSRVNYDTGRGCVAVVLTPVSDGDTGDDAGPSEPGGDVGDDVEPSEPGSGDVEGDAEPSEPGGGSAWDGWPPRPWGRNLEDDAGTLDSDDRDIGEDGEEPGEDGGDTGDDAQPSEPNKNVTMNGTLTLSVEEIIDTRAGDAFNGTLTDGRYMLYANYYNGNDGLLNDLRSLKAGQKVSVTVGGVSEQWADAAYGITGLYTLLRDGEIASGLPAAANPYTAVGVRADGSAVFYTIDGRQNGYSIGATYAQVAQRLQELGCVDAVALDGGGSTSFGATLPGRQKFGLLNRPSQTGRLLNNFIFFVEADGYAGMDPGVYLSSDTQVVFTGASLNVSAVTYGRWGEEVPSAASGVFEVMPDGFAAAPMWSATGGTIKGDGLSAVYTAGDAAGRYTIKADSRAELPVQVVDTLNSLQVTWEGCSAEECSLNLMPRESVDLSAAGTWMNLPVAMSDSNVTWEADTAIGTIDASGVFTAAGWNEAVTGNITASCGGQTATVQVTVQAYPFADIKDHWSADYLIRLYKLGLVSGYGQPDGTAIFLPDIELSRGELLVFITRLLHLDTDEYQDVTLPFADMDAIPEWMIPSVKAMYALRILNGSGADGMLYANVGGGVSREEAMTMLGRVLAEQVSQDLSGFADSDMVSEWARPYVETLVGLNVVQGSSGVLSPQSIITRGEAAKLLAEVYGLEKAELTPRPSGPEDDEPGTQEPGEPGETPDGPNQSGEATGDPVSTGEPVETPDGPNRPGEETGNPVSLDEPSADPLD